MDHKATPEASNQPSRVEFPDAQAAGRNSLPASIMSPARLESSSVTSLTAVSLRI